MGGCVQPSKPLRIFLFGKRGAGKSTVARRLRHQVPDGVVMSIAEPLYEIACRLFGMKQKDRRLLQVLGDKLREIDQDCLLNALLRKAQDYPGLVVVDDVRLVHEAEMLRHHGFVAVKVVADNSARLERLKAKGEEIRADEDFHATETEVDLIVPDWVLVNNCAPADLEAKVHDLYRSICAAQVAI